MKEGARWEEVSKMSGKSTLYNALRKYFKYAKEKVGRHQKEIVELNTILKGKKDELDKINSTLESKKSSVEELEASRARIKGEHGKLNEEVKEMEEKRDRLEVEIKKIEDRGITDRSIKIIGRIDFGSEDELINRIETFETYRQLEANEKSLRQELSKKSRELKEVESELEDLSRLRAEEMNAIDEIRRRSWMYEEANKVVVDLLDKGFDAEVIQDLGNALDRLAVKGQPKTSIKRLFDGLRGVKELAEIESSIRMKKAELENTETEISNVKGILDALKNNVLEKINRMRTESIRQIEAMGKKSHKKMDLSYEHYRKNLGQFAEEQKRHIKELRESTEANITNTTRTMDQQMAISMARMNNLVSGFNKEIQKWGKVKEEMGRYEAIMRYGYILFGLLEHPDSIKEIPMETISQLVNRIHLWTSHNLPEANTIPSENVINMEFKFSKYSSYKLVSLTRWLTEEFYKMEGGL